MPRYTFYRFQPQMQPARTPAFTTIAAKSVHVLYELSKLNAMLPEVVGRPPVQWQAFPLRHSLIPAYVKFDIGIVASHILNLPLRKFVSSTKIQTTGNKTEILIEGHSGGGLVEENSIEHSGRMGMELVS
jgi:hypothetical protein